MNLAVLDVPAMMLAGLVASPHCAAMCGLWQARASHRGRADIAFQAGRVITYAGLGALAGGIASLLLQWMGGQGVGEALRWGALVGLMVAVLWPRRSSSPRCHGRHATLRGGVAGMVLGVVPCPLLYGAAGYAALSADAARGAMLMAAFALGSVPLLQTAAWGWRRLAHPPTPGGSPGAVRWWRLSAVMLSLTVLLAGGGGVVWRCLA